MIVPVKYIENSCKIWDTYNIKNKQTNKKTTKIKAFTKKPAVAKFSEVNHFVIIIVSYLALIRLQFVEPGFCQIKRKCMQYNTILVERAYFWDHLDITCF